MEDALSRYLAASEAGDVAGIAGCLADDVEVVSPISGRMVFRGRDDVEFLLGAVYGSLNHLRPWLALTLFALVLGPKVARRPGMIWRALAG